MEDGFANSAIKYHVDNTRPYGDVESFVIIVGQLPGDFSESNCWIFIMCSERWINDIVL
jgi:hypothetical protein